MPKFEVNGHCVVEPHYSPHASGKGKQNIILQHGMMGNDLSLSPLSWHTVAMWASSRALTADLLKL